MWSARRHAIMFLATTLIECGRAPGTYDLTVHEAYQRLANNKLEDFRFKRQCGILIHFVPDASPDQSVTWHVFSSGVELLKFTANLTPVGDRQTRITVNVSKDPDATEAYEGSDFYPRPALRQPLRPAVEEAIAAELEGRAFDPAKVPLPSETDSVCNVQRAGLEAGHRFSIHDAPGTWDN
jgi:hypothetical protein